MKKKRKNRLFGFLGSASGGGAVASAHNVCHSICIGFASLLAMFGIIISDTALMFLQDYNIYFWLMGMFFLLLSVALLIKEKPVSIKMMIFNTGLLAASLPFYQSIFLLIGGVLVSIFAVLWFAKEKMEVILWEKN
ncbi:MAG: hypothetical protein QMD85_03225 [Candidatus Aenigmarchaeota archaeon]|nr:hypothetical protein [Candidatus Aenigmarchaeota archaeon]MDI6722547.1 hypothetical protein [Candidatus Aenigmarchaeota archaeon]